MLIKVTRFQFQLEWRCDDIGSDRANWWLRIIGRSSAGGMCILGIGMIRQRVDSREHSGYSWEYVSFYYPVVLSAGVPLQHCRQLAMAASVVAVMAELFPSTATVADMERQLYRDLSFHAYPLSPSDRSGDSCFVETVCLLK